MSFILEELKRHPFYSNRIFPTSEKRLNVFLTIGLPGVGKSTFCELMRASCPLYTCRVISRDETRVELLWDMRKMSSEEQEERKRMLDQLVTHSMMNKVTALISNASNGIKTLIIDGCHTKMTELVGLLGTIRQAADLAFRDVLINIVLVGNLDSECRHQLSDKKAGDYSDYEFTGRHTAVPKEIFEHKRKQLSELLTPECFKVISEMVDFVFTWPAYDPKCNCGQ